MPPGGGFKKNKKLWHQYNSIMQSTTYIHISVLLQYVHGSYIVTSPGSSAG